LLRHGEPDLAVINISWHLQQPEIEQELEEDEETTFSVELTRV
jgi:hypothetical protein